MQWCGAVSGQRDAIAFAEKIDALRTRDDLKRLAFGLHALGV